MNRLGYTRYDAQGGDVGAPVTDAMGRQAPQGLVGIHTNLLVTALANADAPPAEPSEKERAALDAINTFRASGFGYFLEQATRPQTIGYSLLDSPVALAAWMLDHDTDAYYKMSRAFVEGQPTGNLTRDHILDNITLYWLTGTGASAARSYWENGRAQAAALAAGQAPPEVSLPVGYTTFPARSSGPRAAGSSSRTPTSPTSTRSTGAVTSPHGKSRSSSLRRSARPSGRSANAYLKEEELWPCSRRRESGAPISSSTITAFPDAKSSRTAWTLARKRQPSSTSIRAKRSSMFSKGRWSIRSRAS
jgi:hypothetical protein